MKIPHVVLVIIASLVLVIMFSLSIKYSSYFGFSISAILTITFVMHVFQRDNPLLRNYPIIGLIPLALSYLRPVIRKHILEPFSDENPYNHRISKIAYSRAKGKEVNVSFGSGFMPNTAGYEWIAHSINSISPPALDRVKIGGKNCLKPYLSSRINISAMGYATLSKNAVLSLNLAAKLGNFAQNTGEDGICPFHLEHGGDIIWQIGTDYSGCRTEGNEFDFNFFKINSRLENIKMIEIKLSQGAKPGIGGLMQKLITIERLIDFVSKLRDLSRGKPIGLKLCLGNPMEFDKLCDEMIEKNTFVDYIQIDGSEGGTIAAPWEFVNHVGMPLFDALYYIQNTLVEKKLRNDIKILCSGRILTGFDIFKAIALGADVCCIARGMLLALGCIQAKKCDTGGCPTGIATQDIYKSRAIVVEQKSIDIFNYHKLTLQSFSLLLGAAGLGSIDKIRPTHVYRRFSDGTFKSYGEIYSYSKLLKETKN